LWKKREGRSVLVIMRTRTLVLIAVAVFAVLVGGFVYVALGGGDDTRRAGAFARSYSAGSWVLVDSTDTVMAYPKEVSCGSIHAPPVLDPPAKGESDPKHAGAASPDPCSLRVNLTRFQPGLVGWVNETFGGSAAPRAVAILGLDTGGAEKLRLRLPSASITAFELDPLSAAAQEQVLFTIELKSDSMSAVAPSGATFQSSAGSTKSALGSNFKLTYGADPVTYATRIDNWRFEANPGARPDAGDLEVSVAEAHPFAPFESAMSGLSKGTEAKKPAAKIEFMNSTLSAALGSLDLRGTSMLGGDLVGQAPAGGGLATRTYTLGVGGATLAVAP
jgi:hypothetical protein